MTTLYHYCSNDSFVAIIESNSIRLSELSLSNDYLEGKWVREVFANACRDKAVNEDQIAHLLERLDLIIRFVGAAGFCLSRRGDVLSQWRGYADSGKGVSIWFNEAALVKICHEYRQSEFSVGIAAVEYDKTKQKENMLPLIDEILELVEQGALNAPLQGLLTDEQEYKEKLKVWQEAASALSGRFIEMVPHIFTLKNPAFEEEQEVRMVSGVVKSTLDNELGQLPDMEFRSVGDRIVPYFTLELANVAEEKIIDHVVLGPLNSTPTNFVQAFLKRHGHKDSDVTHSSASLSR